jgi:aryl-alcohol dehydrogenase-like predicted oxidoreductase
MDRRKFMGTMVSLSAAGTLGLGFKLEEEVINSDVRKGSIPRRKLGKTGVEVSCLIIGGVSGMMALPTKDFDPAELANAALDSGINYFDTAASYGNNNQSEKNYGKVIAGRRKEIFLSTKTGNRKYDGAMKEIEQSLKNLQTDHLDLWNIHGVSPAEDIMLWDKPDGCLKAFYKMRDEKVIRFIGVTGHSDADTMIRAINTYEFDTILTTFNPCPRRKPFRDLVIPVAVKKNMGIINMKVMGGGGGALVLGNPPVTETGKEFARKNWYWDESSKQVEASTLIRYSLGLPISCCVVGMKSLKELANNVAAAKMKPLTREEQISVEQLMADAS